MWSDLYQSQKYEQTECFKADKILHDIILLDTLINLGTHFPIFDGKLSRSKGSKAPPYHDAPSTVLDCWDDVSMLVMVPFLHHT